jgi:hypothetical protein
MRGGILLAKGMFSTTGRGFTKRKPKNYFYFTDRQKSSEVLAKDYFQKPWF